MFVLLELSFATVLLIHLKCSGYKKGLLLLFIQLCIFVNAPVTKITTIISIIFVTKFGFSTYFEGFTHAHVNYHDAGLAPFCCYNHMTYFYQVSGTQIFYLRSTILLSNKSFHINDLHTRLSGRHLR